MLETFGVDGSILNGIKGMHADSEACVRLNVEKGKVIFRLLCY